MPPKSTIGVKAMKAASKPVREHPAKMKAKMLHPVGVVRIQRVDGKTGEVIDEQRYENLLVDNFYVQTARLFAGDDMSDRKIAKIAFGVNGDLASVNDTAITPPPGGNVLVDVTIEYSTTNSVQFTGVLGTSEGNGIEFREIGLLFNNTSPALAARKAFKIVTKDDWFMLRIIWTITYS
jgi:hypothetical protein